MVIHVPPRLPGFQLLRDTFAGKNLTEICRRETDSEKPSDFYRQKCRAENPGLLGAQGLLLLKQFIESPLIARTRP